MQIEIGGRDSTLVGKAPFVASVPFVGELGEIASEMDDSFVVLISSFDEETEEGMIFSSPQPPVFPSSGG